MADVTPIDDEQVKGQGWASFATWLITLAGIFHVLAAVAMLAKKENFNETSLVYFNLTSFAVAFLIIAAVQFAAAFMLHRRQPGGRILGIFVALLGACIWFFGLDARPAMAIVMITLNTLVMYGLTSNPQAFYKGD
jgi:hypothetical protein